MALTKGDLQAVRSVVREELTVTEGRLSRKIETEVEKLAQITGRQFERLRRRTDALAHHVGYAFGPEVDEITER